MKKCDLSEQILEEEAHKYKTGESSAEGLILSIIKSDLKSDNHHERGDLLNYFNQINKDFSGVFAKLDDSQKGEFYLRTAYLLRNLPESEKLKTILNNITPDMILETALDFLSKIEQQEAISEDDRSMLSSINENDALVEIIKRDNQSLFASAITKRDNLVSLVFDEFEVRPQVDQDNDMVLIAGELDH